MKEIKDKVEAVLFAVGRKIDLEELSKITKVSDTNKIEEALKELQKDYSEREGSISLINEGNLWKMGVADSQIHTVQDLISETELDKQTMETLAVIAYKAPVLQSNVIRIRTNKAYDHLKILEELGYITREISGRTRLIKLSQHFFKYFDVPSDQMKQMFNTVQEAEEAVEEKEGELKELKEQVKEMEKQKKKEAKEEQKKEKTQEKALEDVDQELMEEGVIDEVEEEEKKEAYEIELEKLDEEEKEKKKLKKEKEKRKKEREARKAEKESAKDEVEEETEEENSQSDSEELDEENKENVEEEVEEEITESENSEDNSEEKTQ